MRKGLLPFLLMTAALLLSACNPTRVLTGNQRMLLRNNVDVKGTSSADLDDDLKSYCRPIPNTRFLTVFLIKPRLYAMGQPKVDKKTGELTDTKMRKWLREKAGEPPVLLDSSKIEESIDQLKIVMKQKGYFDADVSYKVVPQKKDPKKVRANYLVTANKPYFISSVSYNIDIPEYKKIVILNKDACLISEGMQYNEEVISDELTRIINLIRDEGYYYVEKSIISCEVSYDPPVDSLQLNPHTVSLEIILKVPKNDNASRYLYKYTYRNAYILPNFTTATASIPQDTVKFRARNKRDSTRYYFITPHLNWMDKPLKDFHYGTLANTIYSKRGVPYSQTVRRRTSQSISQLDNFSYYNIEYKENEKMLDTVKKTGVLDTYIRLTPMKIHSIGGQIDLRNDKSAISFSYLNRNIFKGAEHLLINVSGGYFYYSLNNLFHHNTTYAYPEFGISASLAFPKLFLFNKTQKETGIRYSTSVNASVNYSGLYRRLMYNIGMTYNWSPSYYLNHSVSPIDISTINNSDRRAARVLNYDNYPESYQHKFGKFFLLSFKYSMNYLVPFDVTRNRHNMRISLNFESSGLFLKGLNALFSPDERWIISKNSLDSLGYGYSTFEKVEFTWNYTYKINKNNSFATRLSAGAILPLDKDSYIPYERGFYLGTSNSMRGWGYRGLGPGSYEHGKDSLYTGDIKIEWNLEYRGTIYKSFKYGIFSDIGNIWLARESEDMPNAEFSISRFYKELAVDVGVGIRLDFNFLVFRVDYAIPIFDPTRYNYGTWINPEWFKNTRRPFRWSNGIKIAIGYAF
ncbi:MAG: BamA/TamA family outer membrane protein [Bacteroidales bacterium]|nr:BamA/TamA family outer membrane protein [Bacteroidales bacterium]